jgi:hypothetical protein
VSVQHILHKFIYIMITCNATSNNEQVQAVPGDATAVIGCMKCMDALGQWEDVVQLCDDSWAALTSSGVDDKAHRKAATLAARATWSLGQWGRCDAPHYCFLLKTSS